MRKAVRFSITLQNDEVHKFVGEIRSSANDTLGHTLSSLVKHIAENGFWSETQRNVFISPHSIRTIENHYKEAAE